MNLQSLLKANGLKSVSDLRKQSVETRLTIGHDLLKDKKPNRADFLSKRLDRLKK